MSRKKAILLATITGFICLGIGAASHSGSKASASTPRVVTHTVTKNHTVYRTRTVHRTPQSCVTALTGLRRAAIVETAGVQSMLRGVQTFSTGPIQQGTAKVKVATGIVGDITPAYTACLASAN